MYRTLLRKPTMVIFVFSVVDYFLLNLLSLDLTLGLQCPCKKKKSHVWQWAFLMPVLRDRKIEGSQELGNQETPGSIRNLVSKPKWRNYLSIWHQSPDVIFWPQLPCTYIYVYANTLLLLSSVGKSFLSYHVCVSYVHVYIHTNVYTMHMAQTKQILMTHTEKLKK